MPRLDLAQFSLNSLRMLVTAIGRHGATEDYINAESEFNRPPRRQRRPYVEPPEVRHGIPEPHVHQIDRPELPTTAETLQELKRRLAKELYRVELDLQSGARISGKPCDCLSRAKHSAGIEATAEELMSYEQNPIYGKVIQWIDDHSTVFEPTEIAKHPPAFYQAMAPEVRAFRKEVMGTEHIMVMLSDEDQRKLVKKMKEAKE